MHAVETSDKCGLPASRGPHDGGHLLLGKGEIHLLHGPFVLEVGRQGNCLQNRTFHLLTTILTAIFRASTNPTKTQEAPQAIRCHSGYGLVA